MNEGIGVGVDVSKAGLDAHAHGQQRGRHFANTPSGIAALALWLSALSPRQVVLEATGGYERPALDYLASQNLPVVRINPRQGRDFAKATGQLAKTDQLDARCLAHMAQVLTLRLYQPPAAWQVRLAQYQQQRAYVVEALQRDQQRLSTLQDTWLKQQAKALITRQRALLKALDARISEQIGQQPQWASLQEIKGVGPVMLSMLMGQLPELGQLSGKAIAKLVGVAPLAHDSGSYRGTRRIWGGRPAIRACLYMATLTAVRYEPALREFYDRLRERGKPAKVALVACMRKLLVILNARQRDAMNACKTV